MGYDVGFGYDGVRVAVTRSVGDGVRKSRMSGVAVPKESKVSVARAVSVASSAGFGSCSPMMAKFPSAKMVSSFNAMMLNCSGVPGTISVPVQ